MFNSTKSNGLNHHTKQVNEVKKHQAFSVIVNFDIMLEMNFYVCFCNTLTDFFNVILKFLRNVSGCHYYRTVNCIILHNHMRTSIRTAMAQ